ncbi:MAG: tetratricopeptide repeat protein [Myxococcales bacterium]
MDVRVMKEEAAALYLKGKYSKAVQAYQQLIKLQPNDPRLRLRHAEACRRTRQVDVAAASLHAAAVLFESQGQWSCAHAVLKLALELQPQSRVLIDAYRDIEAKNPNLRFAGPRLAIEPRPTS